MKTYVASLESISPYSQSKYIDKSLKLDRERDDVFEERIWRERLHVNDKGMVFIPPMVWKNGITEAAQQLNLKVPGMKNRTYTKVFQSGIMVTEPIELPWKKEDVPGEWLHLNSDGKKGGGTRVRKCMPYIPSWKADVQFTILNDLITLEVFRQVIEGFGIFIGIGRFRPDKGGFYGRFKVLDVVQL